MGRLHLQHVKTDRPDLGALGAQAMADRLLGVERHQPLELGAGRLVLGMGLAGSFEGCRKIGPGIGGGHIDDPHGA